MTFNLIRYIATVVVILCLSACKHSESGSSRSADAGLLDSQGVPVFEFQSQTFEAVSAADVGCAKDAPEVFFTLKGGFNIDNAYLLLLASLTTEQDIPVAKSQFEKWGFMGVEVWEHKLLGMRAYVAEHDEFVLVAYRGTSNPAEYLSNAMFTTTDADFNTDSTEQLSPSKAHRGFWGVHKNTRDAMHNLIVQMGGAEKPVLFAGHSRGGALATLQAAYFAKKGGEIASIYTFAQPGLGNTSLSTALNNLLGDRYYRMDYELDVTPRVPPSKDMAAPLNNEGYIPSWLADVVEKLDYEHDPGELYLLSESGYLEHDLNGYNSQLEFWRKLFTTFPNPILSLPDLIKYFPNNHNPRVYICSLAGSM